MRPFLIRQERPFGDKINATFQFIGQNFKPLFTALLYLVIPISLLSGIFNALFQADLQKTIRDLTESAKGSNDPTDLVSNFLGMITQSFTSPLALLSIIFAILSSALIQMVVISYFKCYDETDENPIQLSSIVDSIKNNLLSIILLGIVSTFLAIVGFVFFILPGIYILIVLSLSSYVLMIENVGIGEAISRSFKLINGKWWSTFGLLFVMFICVGILGMAVGIPAGVVSFFEASNLLQGEASILYIATTAITSAFTTILNSVIYVALGFQYFSLVERHDNLGLRRQINNLGSNTSPKPNLEEGEF